MSIGDNWFKFTSLGRERERERERERKKRRVSSREKTSCLKMERKREIVSRCVVE